MANIQTNTRNLYYAILSITEQSQSNAANSTTLAYSLTLYSGNTRFSGYTIGYRIKVDGVQIDYHDNTGNQTSIGRNEAKLVTSGTTTVLHNDDGTKTISAEVELWTDSGAYLPVYISGSGQVKLTQILRESTISATDANIGAVSMIAVNRKSAAYTHSIRYAFGGLSGYITADGGVSASEVKLSSTYIGWTLPASFYAQIPAAKSGKCTLTCKTYSGSTQIGSAKTCTLTCVASESACAPQVTASVTASDELTPTLTGSNTKLIRYCSDALCTISATARNSATLRQKRIAGQVIDGTSRTISAIEADAVTFDAIDSRGYSTAVTVPVDLVPYVKLTCRVSTVRETPTGDKVMLYISGSWYNGSFGAADNTLTLKYKLGGASAWTAVTPTLTGNTYSAQVELTGVSYNATHTLSVLAADKLSTVQVSDTIKRGVPVFDWGEKDFEFHVPVIAPAASVALTGGTGNAGYVRIAAIRVIGLYINCPISLIISRKATGRFQEVILRFASTDTTDPALELLTVTGGMDVFARRTSAGAWEVYAAKVSAGDVLAVLDLRYNLAYLANRLLIDINSDGYLASKPSGAIEATMASVGLGSSDVSGVLPTTNGGTGGTTAAEARRNLLGDYRAVLLSDGTIANGTPIKGTLDRSLYKSILIMLEVTTDGGTASLYTSYIIPHLDKVWGLYIPATAAGVHYKGALTITGNAWLLQIDSGAVSFHVRIYGGL